MLPKLAVAVAFATTLGFAASMPNDLIVNAVTSKAMGSAVQQGLGAKPATEANRFTLNFANDKNLRRALEAMGTMGPTGKCAIPLLEVKGGSGHDIDPLAKPVGKSNFDAIGKPAPLKPCPVRPDLAK